MSDNFNQFVPGTWLDVPFWPFRAIAGVLGLRARVPLDTWPAPLVKYAMTKYPEWLIAALRSWETSALTAYIHRTEEGGGDEHLQEAWRDMAVESEISRREEERDPGAAHRRYLEEQRRYQEAEEKKRLKREAEERARQEPREQFFSSENKDPWRG